VVVLTAGLYAPEFGPTNHPPEAEIEIVDDLATTKSFFESKFPLSKLSIEKVKWPDQYSFK
jgi:hypothetical protein